MTDRMAWLRELGDTAREAEKAGIEADVNMHDIGNRAARTGHAFRFACTPERIAALVAVAEAALLMELESHRSYADRSSEDIIRDFRDARQVLSDAVDRLSTVGVPPDEQGANR